MRKSYLSERDLKKTIKKRVNLKTMSELNEVVKLKTSKNKVVEYKQQSNIAFQLLVKSQQQEAKLNMQHLLSYTLTTIPYSIATIMDGNNCFYYMTEIPDNLQLICLKVFNMIPKDADVIFSTDTYKKDSIKAIGRKGRGCGEKLIVRGESTKKPDRWKSVLANDDKKGS